MSPDSVNQWQQAHDLSYLSDAHPAFHTLTIWAITRVWDSPAAIALVQIITMSLVIAIGLYRMRVEGVPAWAIWTIVILFCAIPINGAMLVTLWKDIPYAIALLGLTLVFWHIAITGRAWLKYQWSWLWLGSIAALVSLIRHNGLPVALFSLAALAMYYPKRLRTAIFSLVFLLKHNFYRTRPFI